MYGNKHIGGRKKEMESYYNMVLTYEGIWNYLKKTVIDLKIDITNLRVNTSIPSAKKEAEEVKSGGENEIPKILNASKINSKSGDSSQIWEEGKVSS